MPQKQTKKKTESERQKGKAKGDGKTWGDGTSPTPSSLLKEEGMENKKGERRGSPHTHNSLQPEIEKKDKKDGEKAPQKDPMEPKYGEKLQ